MNKGEYEQLLAIHQSLVEIRTTLLRMERAHQDHETRLRVLEQASERAKGALMAYAGVGGIISGLIIALIQYLIGT